MTTYAHPLAKVPASVWVDVAMSGMNKEWLFCLSETSKQMRIALAPAVEFVKRRCLEEAKKPVFWKLVTCTNQRRIVELLLSKANQDIEPETLRFLISFVNRAKEASLLEMFCKAFLPTNPAVNSNWFAKEIGYTLENNLQEQAWTLARWGVRPGYYAMVDGKNTDYMFDIIQSGFERNPSRSRLIVNVILHMYGDQDSLANENRWYDWSGIALRCLKLEDYGLLSQVMYTGFRVPVKNEEDFLSHLTSATQFQHYFKYHPHRQDSVLLNVAQKNRSLLNQIAEVCFART